MRYKPPKPNGHGNANGSNNATGSGSVASRACAHEASSKAAAGSRHVGAPACQDVPARREASARREPPTHREAPASQNLGRRRFPLLAAITAVAIIGLAILLGYLVLNIGSGGSGNPAATDTDIDNALQQKAEPTPREIRLMEAIEAGASADDPNVYYLPTPLVASCGNMSIHSPIAPSDITEVEFHQASYDYALPLTPLVTMVDAEEVAEKHGTKRPPFSEQPYGDKPLIAEAVSTLRIDSEGVEMSSIDVGALTGMFVYAPISGTVVRIRPYSLFGQIDDYEVHIQNPEHPEWDIVLLHIDNLMVNVGDEVYGGCTRIAKVRNIGDVIDNNLANFTRLGDPGNHCHLQVNDATRNSYRGLEGALDIFNGRGYARPEPPPEPTNENGQG